MRRFVSVSGPNSHQARGHQSDFIFDVVVGTADNHKNEIGKVREAPLQHQLKAWVICHISVVVFAVFFQ